MSKEIGARFTLITGAMAACLSLPPCGLAQSGTLSIPACESPPATTSTRLLKGTVSAEHYAADKNAPAAKTLPADKSKAASGRAEQPGIKKQPAQASADKAAQLAAMKAELARYQQPGARQPHMMYLGRKPSILPETPRALTAEQASEQAANKAAAIAAIRETVARYQHQAAEHPMRMAYVAPRAVPQTPVEAPVQRVPTASELAQIRAAVERYQSGGQPAASGSASKSPGAPVANKLPRWGDKDCLCHDALKLFKQHRYLQAAQTYHRAGENMLLAWGHPNCDVANAYRGEAVCLSEAGQPARARDLFRQAIDIYIRNGKSASSQDLENTMLDLSTTYKALGCQRTAAMLESSAGRIRALSQANPLQAALEFARVATN